MKTTTATPWIQHPRFLKILYPTLVAVAMVLLWQGAVSYFRIPAFLVPSPLVMLESLWTHLTPLLLALLFTLKITLISFLLSIVIGAAVAFILVQNRFVETALFPYIVFLQVTPIVAIAPLIIIWVKDATLSLVVCATLMAVFPIISNTTQGLRSVSPGLLSYFRLNHASRWQTLRRVIFPAVLPALLTGFTLAFARATGEFGSVIFIAGNIPLVSEITPLLIISKLEQYDYAGASAIAVLMLVISFVLLLAINLIQWWASRRPGHR